MSNSRSTLVAEEGGTFAGSEGLNVHRARTWPPPPIFRYDGLMIRATSLSVAVVSAALALLGSCAHRRATGGDPCVQDRDCQRGYGCLEMGGGEQAPYSVCYPLTDGEFVADSFPPRLVAH